MSVLGGWNLIDAAPWDGVKYLVTDGQQIWIASRRRGTMHRDGAPIDGHDFNRPQGSYAGHPTHWMPLPEPPA